MASALRRSGVLDPTEQLHAMGQLGLAEFHHLPEVPWRLAPLRSPGLVAEHGFTQRSGIHMQLHV